MDGDRELQALSLAVIQRPSWPRASFLARLQPEALAQLLAGRPATTFTAGQSLIVEGGAGDAVFLLLDAVVKVTVRADRGRALLALRVSGDVVGEMAVADGGARSATVTAASDGDVVVAIPGPAFTAVMGRHPAAARLVAAELSSKLRASDRRRADFAGSKVDVRVARVLLELAENYGLPEPGRPSTVILRLGLTQRDLAALAGAGEAAVANALKKLYEQRIITRGYREITVSDIDSLRRTASADNSALIPLLSES